MDPRSLLVVLLACAVALAGCTGGTGDDPATNTTTTTTTPTDNDPTTNGTGGNETDETPPAPLDCPEPPASNATAPRTVMGYPEVVFTVKEPSGSDPCFGFVGPASARAGWTAVTLQNDGRQPHIMPMYFLGNHTRAEAVAALASNQTPEWLQPVGGVGFATPFSNGTVVLNLTQGSYLVVCFFGGHHAQGMYRVLNVTAGTGNATAQEPRADVTIEMKDFSFNVPNVTAGRKVVRVVNNGTQPHEAPLVLLVGNATIENFTAAVESPGPTPPPGSGVGGVNVLAPGASAYAIVDFQAGRDYGLVCFVEDPASHKPHVALGMMEQFRVA